MTIAPPRALSREPSPPREPGVAGAALRPVIVTAVLVVHDGAPWLKQCLDALALQTRPPDRLVIVDTGSTDRSRLIEAGHVRVREVFGEPLVIPAPRESTFGEAVGRAVDQLSAAWGSSWDPDAQDWLWLLHDDSAAAPDALALLLDAARRSPSVGIAGPKLTMWDDPSRLLEVGQQITRSGGRAGGPAPGEPDQGQHDHRTDVLSVNTSGMLIRRDVFDEVGGFDPAFGAFRDDLDLSWRAHLAGHRVVVVPKARMREAAASANGQRSGGPSALAARRRDRRHGRQVALARCSPYAVPFLALWIALASLGSAVLLLMLKRPQRAWVELSGLGSLLTPWRPVSARWRSRGARSVRRRDLRGLFATRRSGFRQAFETIHDAVGMAPDRSAPDRVSSAQSLETGPGSDDSESLEEPMLGVASRIIRHPGFLAVMVGALASLATWRSLLSGLVSANGQGFSGGELLPLSTDASSLLHGWLDGWHGAGLGNSLEPAPYLPVLAAGAWVVEHLPVIAAPASSVGTAVAWLLVGAIPLSAWTAYLGARVATKARWPRAWAALAWASLGTLTTAQAGGRLGAIAAHILLPLVVAGFVCAARRSTGVALTFGSALALGVLGAFNPALAALGAFAALLLLVLGRGATRLRAAVLLFVPAGLLGPWILQLVDDPRLLLTGPGLTLSDGAAAAPWQLAMLHPGGPGSYPVLLSAPIVVAGVIAMLRRGTASRAMTMLAALAVTGLALGLASPHVVVGRVPEGFSGAGAQITVWAGTGLDLAALALIAAAVLGLDGLSGRLSRSGFGWRQLLVGPVVVAAVLGVVASIAAAGWLAVGGPLTTKVPSMPAVAADQAEGPLGSRLLEMTTEEGTIGYRLVGGEPGAAVRDLTGVVPPPNALLAAAVRIAVSDSDAASANAARDALADQGVGFVAFRGAATEPLVRHLDATAGMTRLSANGGLILWRVLPRDNAVSSSRLRLEDAQAGVLRSIPVTGGHGQTDVWVGAAAVPVPTPDAPAADAPVPLTPAALGRRLVVAEPAGWAGRARVSFAGHVLTVAPGGAQPSYVLPSNAGHLTITLAPTLQWWRWGQLGLLLVVLFLAAPFGSARSRRTS
ncbi:MAG: glycosyltransferase [Actinomycetota bacterium]